MSLLSAFNSARASLASVAIQSSVVSRNVANVDNPGATRKIADLSVTTPGGVRVVSVSQSSHPALYASLINSSSSLGNASVTAEALDRLSDAIGDVDSDGSPAATIAALQGALTQYAASPENTQLARAAVDAARDVASSLNRATDAVQAMRQQADDDLANAAGSMNALLKELETVNQRVVSGTATGADVTDAVDRRDAIVTELSGYVGLNVQKRAGNDLVLSTDSGIVLFERTARPVEFAATSGFAPGSSGGAFRIDGVEISGSNSPMPIKSGSLAGLLTLRDQTAGTLQGQLDALAGSLASAFAETDQAAGTTDTTLYYGLFDGGEGGAIDLATQTTGLAGRLRIAASVDPSKGGDPSRLRDGGIAVAGEGGVPAGAVFDVNTSGASGFTDRLNALVGAFSQTRGFAAGPEAGSLGIGASATLGGFAAAMGGYLQGQRSDAAADADYGSVLMARTQETLSDRTGINLDEEMTKLLDLERSYQASSKLIATVGEMIDSLIAIA